MDADIVGLIAASVLIGTGIFLYWLFDLCLRRWLGKEFNDLPLPVEIRMLMFVVSFVALPLLVFLLA